MRTMQALIVSALLRIQGAAQGPKERKSKFRPRGHRNSPKIYEAVPEGGRQVNRYGAVPHTGWQPHNYMMILRRIRGIQAESSTRCVKTAA